MGAPMSRGADTSPVNFYIQLVCGSDADAPPAAQARLVGPKLNHRLHDVFRWKNYWEISHEAVSLKIGGTVRRRVTPDRDVEIAWPTGQKMTISIYTNGKLTRKRDQSIDAAFYIAGGDSNASESWFIIVRRDNPEAAEPSIPKLAAMP
jgi:hypothetical protein